METHQLTARTDADIGLRLELHAPGMRCIHDRCPQGSVVRPTWLESVDRPSAGPTVLADSQMAAEGTAWVGAMRLDATIRHCTSIAKRSNSHLV